MLFSKSKLILALVAMFVMTLSSLVAHANEMPRCPRKAAESLNDVRPDAAQKVLTIDCSAHSSRTPHFSEVQVCTLGTTDQEIFVVVLTESCDRVLLPARAL